MKGSPLTWSCDMFTSTAVTALKSGHTYDPINSTYGNGYGSQSHMENDNDLYVLNTLQKETYTVVQHTANASHTRSRNAGRLTKMRSQSSSSLTPSVTVLSRGQ